MAVTRYDQPVALPKRSRRAYQEAHYRKIHGEPSPAWQGSEYEVEVWMDAFNVAAQENVSPWDALLIAVKRRAARVAWVDNVISALMEQHKRECIETGEGDPNVPPDTVRKWMAESRNEERLMTRSAKMAVDAGVADALVRRWEIEGKLTTAALIAGLDSLDLTPDQRLKALSTMHNALAGDTAPHHSIEGRVIPEPEDQEDDDL